MLNWFRRSPSWGGKYVESGRFLHANVGLSCQDIGTRILEPALEVHLEIIHGGKHSLRILALVDSGSDYSYADGQVATRLFGERWFESQDPDEIRRLGGVELPVYHRPVRLSIGPPKTPARIIDTTVAFTPEPKLPRGRGVLLGQVGFFHKFHEVAFGYKRKTLTLKW